MKEKGQGKEEEKGWRKGQGKQKRRDRGRGRDRVSEREENWLGKGRREGIGGWEGTG